MTAQEIPPLEDGLADKADGLLELYLLYVIPALLVVLVIPTVLFIRLRPPWPFALIIAVPLAVILLILFIFIALRRRGWLAALGLGLAGMIWGVTILRALPPALAVGSIVGGVVLFLLFLMGSLFLLGGYVLPFPPPDPRGQKERLRSRLQNHSTAFKILLDYVSGVHYPFWVVTREPREEDKIEERGEGDAMTMFAIGNGIIISDCDHAVAVSDGIKFKGVQGPGLSFTGFADRPMRTLDLRPQLRAFTVQGLTRDGIQVKVLAFTPFQIDRGEQQPRLGAPFPYRKSAAFLAVHSQMMAVAGGPDHPQHAWDELPRLYGTRILQDILSQYNFDDLYRYDPGEEPPRIRIAREFRERLRDELACFGIHLIGGGISNLLPVREEVLRERVRNWRAEWVRRILVRQAEGQQERLWRIEQARAEAQARLILALGEQLAELDRPDTPVTPQKILDQFLKILEEMTQQPMMRRYLPRETPEELRRLGGEEKEKEASS